jgi:hypothetical protein
MRAQTIVVDYVRVSDRRDGAAGDAGMDGAAGPDAASVPGGD